MHWLKAASCATIWLTLCFISSAAISFYLWFGAWKAAFIVVSRGEKGIREANLESSSGFIGAAGTSKMILEQQKTKWCWEMIYLCNLYLSSLSVPPRVQNITYSVQLQSNLKEPKIVSAEIPSAEGISASTAPTPLNAAAARGSLTAPSVHRDARSWRSRSLSVLALMDGTKCKHSHLGSAVRCLLKNHKLFFFLGKKPWKS